MRVVALCIGLVMVATGCHFSDEVPPEVIVSCTRDTECPSRNSCDVLLGQCVSLEVDALDGPTVWPALVRPGEVVHAEFALTRAALGTPLVQLVTRDGRRWPMTLEGTRASRLSFSMSLDATAPEGEALVITSFVDTAHHTLAALRVGKTTVDTVPPSIDTVTVRLVPADDNALVVAGRGQRLAAAMAGTAIEVEVVSSGDAEAPTVRALPPDQSEPESLMVVARSPGSTRLRWVVPGNRPVSQGAWSLDVTARDVAGSVAQKQVPAAFVVDTVPPAPPPTTQSGAVVLEQAPQGTLAEPGIPSWRLHVSQNGVDSPAVFQAFFGPFLLLTVDSDPRGDVPSAVLPLSTDTADVKVRALDFAGNVSALVTVQDREWVQLASRGASNFQFSSELFEQPCPVPRFGAATYVLGSEVSGGWEQRDFVQKSDVPFVGRTVLYWDPMAQLLVATGSSFLYVNSPVLYTKTVRWLGGGWSQDLAGSYIQSGPLQSLAFDAAAGSPVAVFGGSGYANGMLTGPRLSRLPVSGGSVSSCRSPGRLFTRGPTVYAPMGEQLVYDSRRFRVLAFGGAYDYSGAPPDDVLSIIAEGAVADVPRSGTWPLARAGHAMAYDPVRDLVVVFGGVDAARHLLFSDTWLFDGTRWHSGPVGPPARQDATMAWDPERQVVVLAGGRDDQQRPLSDVWEFDGLAWTPRGSIPPRSSAGLAWHPVERRWFWVGGAMDAGTFGRPIWSTDTFVSLDDGGWDKVVAPAVSPAAPVTVGAAQTLTSVQFAYDLDAGRGFVFAGGGVTDSCSYSGCTHSDYFGNDLFTWSTEPTNAFQPLLVSGPKPPPRADGAFVWSPEHGLVLVGGQAGTTNFGDTWRFADGGWENLDASVPARTSALLAWDASRRRLVLHGGVTPDGGLSSETFEFVDAGWQLVSTAGPVAGLGTAMTWDPVIGGLVLVAPGAQGLSTWVQGGWSSESAVGPLGTGTQSVNWLQSRNELHVGTDNGWQSFVRVRHAGAWQTRDGVRGSLFEHAPGVLAAPSIRAVSVFDARAVRPSIEVSIDVPPVVASGELWSVTARTLAGAQGILDGGVTLGTTLETFLNGVYSEPRVNSAPPSHSAEIEWSTTDPQQLAELRRLQGVVRMRLKPRGFNEFETSVVRLDDVEFRWGFRVTEGRDGG